MEKIKLYGKEWYSITDFMIKHKVGSNATVYNMVKDGRAFKDKFMGKRIFSLNNDYEKCKGVTLKKCKGGEFSNA